MIEGRALSVSPAPRLVRDAAWAELASPPPRRRVAGDLVVHAHWDGGADLDLTVVTLTA